MTRTGDAGNFFIVIGVLGTALAAISKSNSCATMNFSIALSPTFFPNACFIAFIERSLFRDAVTNRPTSSETPGIGADSGMDFSGNTSRGGYCGMNVPGA